MVSIYTVLALGVIAARASAQSKDGLITTVIVYGCSSEVVTETLSTTTESTSTMASTSSESTSTEVSTTVAVTPIASTTSSVTVGTTVGSTGATLPTASGSPLPFNNTAAIAGFSAIGMIIASSLVLFM